MTNDERKAPAHDDASAILVELTKGFPATMKRLAELPAETMPDGFKRAREAWEEAALSLLVVSARARAPARERAWRDGEALAAVAHDPKQRVALVEKYRNMASDERKCFLGGLAAGPEMDGELLKGVADGD